LKNTHKLLQAGCLVAATFFSPHAAAALLACSSASADLDGDGFGWENNQSCRVTADSGTTPTASSGTRPACLLASSDPDGDGFGWEDGRTCVAGATMQNDGNSAPATTGGSGALRSCEFTSSDPDGDGFGWENNGSCRVDSSTGATGGNTGGSGSSDGGQSANLAGSGSSDGGQSATPPVNNGGSGGNSNGGSFSVSNPGSVSRSSSLSPVTQNPSDSCLTLSDTLNRNYHGPIVAGDFILSTNAWNAGAANGYDWEQCIFANENGAAVGWTYDWGAGGGSGDFFVRSYPELIYGVKSQGEISAPKSVTGLPVRIDQMPFTSINYSISSSEFGPPRAVDASNNSRFPNGTIISGERNIAVESFLHPSDASGNCPESVVQRSSGGSNHTFEIMVWLDSGAERLPAGPNDFVTNVTLDGAPYKVYTKNSDRKYIAFVAQNPQSSGTIVWSTFVEWAKLYAHRVQQEFGANTNAVQIQDDWCLANILVGTEIFWGAGNLNIIDWQINQN